jgi:hypothetical protein
MGNHKKTMEKVLREIYYQPVSPSGYTSQKKLYKAAKKRLPELTLNQVKSWWETQRIPSRFSQAKKKFTRSTFAVPYADHTYGADLADFTNLARFNDGYKWMNVVQDLFSRKLKALIAQKTKTAKETAKGLDILFSKEPPKKKFLTDMGKEYEGECKTVYQKYGIKHYTTSDNVQKVAIVERAILVIKQRLYKIMAAEHTWRWIDKLDDVLKAYNASYNRRLKMTPSEAEQKQNESVVAYNTFGKIHHFIPYQFKVGDVVRILKNQPFQKSYTGNFSNVLFKIYKREKKVGGVPMYYLKELLTKELIIGGFYAQELKKVKIDEDKLPNISRIHGTRLDKDQEEVLVSYPGVPGRKWVLYDSLIPYSEKV